MKKYMLDMTVKESIAGGCARGTTTGCATGANHCLLKLTSDKALPEIRPGQFAQVRVDNSPNTYLRRPISIHYINERENELWLLIQKVGNATRMMANSRVGDVLNLLLPLGNGFTMPSGTDKQRMLIVGGGVGVAPLLFLGERLKAEGHEAVFLLGARTEGDLLQLQYFKSYGEVYITTEDGSCGEKGFVTQHPILKDTHFDAIYTCGPEAMMKAVARHALSASITCEVSLENTMACGIGACLCCVEDTVCGNVCVCTDGPVFNIDKLKWLN
ncbi:MAG: dihydroorotate dehydrogenase electron transfer subunit [Tannerellaceae bacterium]|jgi:dihydroorotate dehydrogenase electron transfer subunit|nr:dihydroorotate dehydrogenase electron transfer subunit [Tannerellaceae bacterium]